MAEQLNLGRWGELDRVDRVDRGIAKILKQNEDSIVGKYNIAPLKFLAILCWSMFVVQLIIRVELLYAELLLACIIILITPTLILVNQLRRDVPKAIEFYGDKLIWRKLFSSSTVSISYNDIQELTFEEKTYKLGYEVIQHKESFCLVAKCAQGIEYKIPWELVAPYHVTKSIIIEFILKRNSNIKFEYKLIMHRFSKFGTWTSLKTGKELKS